MPQLSHILPFIHPVKTAGPSDIDVTALCIDSRKVTAGCMFIAISGSASDGHLFIGKAIEMGATAILCEQLPAEQSAGIAYITVKNTGIAAGLAADAFYGHPSAGLTDGKPG